MKTKNLIKQLSVENLSQEDGEFLVKILISQGILESVVYKASPSSQKFVDFLENFWNWEKSAYIKEKIFF